MQVIGKNKNITQTNMTRTVQSIFTLVSVMVHKSTLLY